MRDEKEDRKEFYFKVAALVGTEPEKGKSIDETPTATKWQYGFSSYPQSQAVVICTHSLRYAEHWKIGHQEKTLEDGPDGSKLRRLGGRIELERRHKWRMVESRGRDLTD
jgi:hypothetical protein